MARTSMWGAWLVVGSVASASAQPVPPLSEAPAVSAAPAAKPKPPGDDDAIDGCKRPRGLVPLPSLGTIAVKDLVTWAAAVSCRNLVYSPAVVEGRWVAVVAPALRVGDVEPLVEAALETVELRLRRRGRTLMVIGEATGSWTPPADSASLVDDPRPASGIKRFDAVEEPARSPLEVAIERGIRKVDGRHYEIKRSLIEELAVSGQAAAGGMRLVPSVQDGKPNGFKLYAIRAGSLAAKLGLANGDTVHAVNDYDLSTPDKALEAYAVAMRAGSWKVLLTRRGKPIELFYKRVD